MDVITVYPEPGNFPAIAKALLEAADHPSQVVSVSHPRAGFIVPEHVFDRFLAVRDTQDSAERKPLEAIGPERQVDESTEESRLELALQESRKRHPGRPRQESPPAVPATLKRRPGRPRKNTDPV